jgi:hypothetical protein
VAGPGGGGGARGSSGRKGEGSNGLVKDVQLCIGAIYLPVSYIVYVFAHLRTFNMFFFGRNGAVVNI